MSLIWEDLSEADILQSDGTEDRSLSNVSKLISPPSANIPSAWPWEELALSSGKFMEMFSVWLNDIFQISRHQDLNPAQQVGSLQHIFPLTSLVKIFLRLVETHSWHVRQTDLSQCVQCEQCVLVLVVAFLFLCQQRLVAGLAGQCLLSVSIRSWTPVNTSAVFS